MRSRLGLFVIGGIVGASLLFAGLYVSRQDSPIISGTRTPNTADMPSGTRMSLPVSNDLSAVLALPTVFSRRAALHRLAAQSNGEQLRALIADANRIPDRSDRETALAIFFRRFCDIDPRAALALASSDPHAKIDRYRDNVWQTWARNDLADAIIAVKDVALDTDQAAAVQSLYAAYGYMRNDNTDRIFSQTGIEQNRQTRLRYLRVLLRDSPTDVVNFINTEPSRLRRDEYISWFAYALDVNYPDAAFSYVGAFESPADRALFKDTIESRFSRLNPVDTVWRALAKDESGPNSEFHNAMEELASQDIGAAIEIFEQIDSSNAKALAAFVIASEIANTNARYALEWLRSLKDMRIDKIEESLLATIAVSDPDFALEAALALPAARRESAIANMMLQIAMSSPEQAASMLNLIPEDVELSRTLRMIGSVWLAKSPSGAIGWLESLDSDRAEQIAEFSVRTAMRTQPDTAVRLLSFLDDKKALASARLIISELAGTGDIDWALSVMEELRGSNIDGLEPSLAAGLVEHDHHAAVQFVQQLPDQETRDAAAAGVAEALARSETNDAATVLPALINGIENTQARNKTIQTIMVRLVLSDKELARQLLERLRISENERDVYLEILRSPDN